MKRFFLVALCASSAVLAAGPTSRAKGGPPQTWSLTIEDTLSDLSTPTMIRSDGLGSYTNAVDGVSLSSQAINFWPRNDLGTRNVSFSNGGAYPSRADLPTPTDFLTPPTGLTGTDRMLLDPHAGGPMMATSMESMAVGTNQCGSFYWVVVDSTTGFAWRVPNFHFNRANVPESSYVVTTRNSATQWTVESAHGACSDNPYNVGMVLHDEPSTVKGRSTTTTYADGYYYVPFRLTYTLQ